MNRASLILKLCGIGIVIGAAGLWASAGIDARPKNHNELTLVGGAIWSQILIPMGLIISAIVDDRLDSFIQAYYLFTGWVLLGVTGVMLVVGESRKLKRQRRTRLSVTLYTDPPQLSKPFDKIYFGIGVLMCIASMITFADFVLNLIFHLIITGLLAFGAYWTTKYLMALSETERETSFSMQSTTAGRKLFLTTSH